MSRTLLVAVSPGPGPGGVSAQLTSTGPGPLPRPGDYVIEVCDVPSNVDGDAVCELVARTHNPDYRTRVFFASYFDLGRDVDRKETDMAVGQPLFLGFKSVADLAARGPQRDQLYYFPVVETEVDDTGRGTTTHRLIVSGLLEGGVIGYVAFDLAREVVMGGRRYGPDGGPSNPQSRIDSAVSLTRSHIRGLGMEPILAVLARPRGYMYLAVTPEHLDYDGETDTFIRRQADDGD